MPHPLSNLGDLFSLVVSDSGAFGVLDLDPCITPHPREGKGFFRKMDFFRQFFTSPDMSMRGTLSWITGLVSYVQIKDFTPCLVYVLRTLR